MCKDITRNKFQFPIIINENDWAKDESHSMHLQHDQPQYKPDATIHLKKTQKFLLPLKLLQILKFSRAPSWAGDCWCSGGAKAPIRHLGKHSECGIQNGFLRHNGPYSSAGRHCGNFEKRRIFLRVPRTHFRQGQRHPYHVFC